MMRYQTVSAECVSLAIGKKPILKACKEEDLHSNNGRIPTKPLRARPIGHDHPHPPQDQALSEVERAPVSASRSQNESNGDVLLQWRKKRTRVSRTAAVEQQVKARRRSAAASASNKLRAAAAMPPPCSTYSGIAHKSSCEPLVAEHSSCPSLSEKPASSLPPDKSTNLDTSSLLRSSRETGDGMGPSTSTRVNIDQFEWPRVYIALSRKEKEDDFLAMKGTKLPQRPKKRPKNVEKALQYCFPGMWLSDLTRGRYEVRERKCVKKKRRGLKGMENMDSDSE